MRRAAEGKKMIAPRGTVTNQEVDSTWALVKAFSGGNFQFLPNYLRNRLKDDLVCQADDHGVVAESSGPARERRTFSVMIAARRRGRDSRFRSLAIRTDVMDLAAANYTLVDLFEEYNEDLVWDALWVDHGRGFSGVPASPSLMGPFASRVKAGEIRWGFTVEGVMSLYTTVAVDGGLLDRVWYVEEGVREVADDVQLAALNIVLPKDDDVEMEDAPHHRLQQELEWKPPCDEDHLLARRHYVD